MADQPNDKILRDHLAVDRTKLANQRTLLSMLRTGLYFEVMGLSVMSLDKLIELRAYAPILFVTGGVFIIVGIINYFRMDKRIGKMYTDIPG